MLLSCCIILNRCSAGCAPSLRSPRLFSHLQQRSWARSKSRELLMATPGSVFLASIFRLQLGARVDGVWGLYSSCEEFACVRSGYWVERKLCILTPSLPMELALTHRSPLPLVLSSLGCKEISRPSSRMPARSFTLSCWLLPMQI